MDVLAGQLFSKVVEKLNLTQQKQTSKQNALKNHRQI